MAISLNRFGFALVIFLAMARISAATVYETSDGRLQFELPERFVQEKSPDAKSLPGRPVNFEWVFTARDKPGRQHVSVTVTRKKDVSILRDLREFAAATAKSESSIGHQTDDPVDLKLDDTNLRGMRAISHIETPQMNLSKILLFVETHDAYEQLAISCPQSEEKRAIDDAMTLAATIRDARALRRRLPEPATRRSPATTPTTASSDGPSSKIWATPDGVLRVSLSPDWQAWDSATGKSAIRAKNETLKVILSIDASARDESTLMDFAKRAQNRAASGIANATLSPIEETTTGAHPTMRYDVSIKTSEDDIAIVGMAIEMGQVRVIAQITGDSASIAAAREELAKIAGTLVARD